LNSTIASPRATTSIVLFMVDELAEREHRDAITPADAVGHRLLFSRADRRALAKSNRDIDEVIAYHLADDAEQAALGFIDELEKAYVHIGRHPATGSPRYAHALNLPGLRSWPLTGYPHLVFCLERTDHIDVWRVLHRQREILVDMQEPDAV
jgi:toxin ParE1/3/4